MFGFLFSWFIGQWGPKISCKKAQTMPNLRLPISSAHNTITMSNIIIFIVVGYFYTPLDNIYINLLNVIITGLFIILEHCCEVDRAPLAALAVELELVEPPDEGGEREETVDQDTEISFLNCPIRKIYNIPQKGLCQVTRLVGWNVPLQCIFSYAAELIGLSIT